MTLRVARHCKAIDPLVDFYTKILGLEVLGTFINHNNYNGTFLGKKSLDWHIEFTESKELPKHLADEDDLLVFYFNTEEEFEQVNNRFRQNGIPEETPQNPYWLDNGITYCDPEGFRLVIALRKAI